jgi:hypothetical protein
MDEFVPWYATAVTDLAPAEAFDHVRQKFVHRARQEVVLVVSAHAG